MYVIYVGLYSLGSLYKSICSEHYLVFWVHENACVFNFVGQQQFVFYFTVSFLNWSHSITYFSTFSTSSCFLIVEVGSFSHWSVICLFFSVLLFNASSLLTHYMLYLKLGIWIYIFFTSTPSVRNYKFTSITGLCCTVEPVWK